MSNNDHKQLKESMIRKGGLRPDNAPPRPPDVRPASFSKPPEKPKQ